MLLMGKINESSITVRQQISFKLFLTYLKYLKVFDLVIYFKWYSFLSFIFINIKYYN